MAWKYNRDGQNHPDGSDDTSSTNRSTSGSTTQKKVATTISRRRGRRISGQTYLDANYSFVRERAPFRFGESSSGRADLSEFWNGCPWPMGLNITWFRMQRGEVCLYQPDAGNAFDYLTNTASTGYGPNFDEAAANADTIQVELLPASCWTQTFWPAFKTMAARE